MWICSSYYRWDTLKLIIFYIIWGVLDSLTMRHTNLLDKLYDYDRNNYLEANEDYSLEFRQNTKGSFTRGGKINLACFTKKMHYITLNSLFAVNLAELFSELSHWYLGRFHLWLIFRLRVRLVVLERFFIDHKLHSSIL